MRTRIAESPEAQNLRADEQQVAVGELRRPVDEGPRSVPRSKIADPELSVAQLEARMHRREEHVLEADVRLAASHHRLTSVEREGGGYLSRLTEERELRPHVAALGAKHERAEGIVDLDAHTLADARSAPCAEEVHAFGVRRAAAPAR